MNSGLQFSLPLKGSAVGLFDAFFGGMETPRKLTPQESFAGVLLAASACDGHISDEEAANLSAAVMRMRLFQRVNDKEFSAVINKLIGILKKKGVDTLIDGCCESLPKELVNAAFANACNIVLADGVIDSEERDFVEKLREKLNVDPTTAKTIVQVMVIKNKG
jgi:tellurite resistance protein